MQALPVGPSTLPEPVAVALGVAAVLSPALTAYYLVRLGVAAPAPDRTTPPDPSRWWLVLAAYAGLSVGVVVLALVALVLPGASVLYPVLFVGAGALTVLQFAAPVAYHYDYRAVRALGVPDWDAAGVTYLAVVHLVGPVLAARYLRERRRHVGTP